MERNWDFSMGLLVNKIDIYTTNEQGQRHFFVRAKRHHHLSLHHRKDKHQDEVLLKKVDVQNVEVYFT